MATIDPTVEQFGTSSVRVTWPHVKNGDTCNPVNLGIYSDRSIQVVGTFGVGGTVQVHGSNDASNFAQLSDLRGTAFAITTAKIEQIEDVTYALKPVVSAGDGTTDLTITMFATRGDH